MQFQQSDEGRGLEVYGQDPFPICWWSFCLVDVVFCLAETLEFHDFLILRKYLELFV
jgi:hypothetical protein